MALRVVDGAGMGVRASVRVYIGGSCPTLEVGKTTLGSGTRRGELGGLVGDDVRVSVGSVLTGCGCSLAS